MGRWIPAHPDLPWDDTARPQHDYPTPPDVWERDPDEPVGYLLGPTGDVARVVMPERQPFGFQSKRNPRPRRSP